MVIVKFERKWFPMSAIKKKATISLIRSETFSLVAEELISILLQNVDRIKKNRALHRAQSRHGRGTTEIPKLCGFARVRKSTA